MGGECMLRFWLLLLIITVVSSCATPRLDDLPPLEEPGAASTVAVERSKHIVGAPATMFVFVEDRRVHGLATGESWTFKLDPGFHHIGYDLGLNRCRKTIELEPNQRYRIRFTPVCDFEPELL